MINSERVTTEFITIAGMDAPTGAERPVAAYCSDVLQNLGFNVEEDNAGAALGGNCGNLYARLPGIGTPVLFSCHTDTVIPCCGKRIAIERDGRIHAAGDTVLGADDVAGIVEIFEGIRSVLEDGKPHRPIEIILSVSEEKKLRGAKVFDFSKVQAKEGYILDVDGPLGTAVLAAPRSYRFVATVHGRAAHAALSPELGINAAVIASTAVSRLNWGRLDNETTSNIGIMRVEGATNIIPASCYLECEVRSLDPARADARIEEMRSVFETTCAEFGGTLDLEIIFSYEAYQIDPAHPVVKRFEAACASLGLTPVLTRSCGGSDNNIYSAQGFHGIVIAPGMHEIHGINEHTSIQELTTMAKMIELLITE